MPFRHDLAAKFIYEYKGYLQFHSTLEALKSAYRSLFTCSQLLTILDPPSGYISPSIDLVGGIDRILKKVEDGYYISQYDFDSELRDFVYRSNDGHLQLGLCSLEIMHFEHDVPLVSISKDGLDVPDIYTVCECFLFYAILKLVNKLIADARLKMNGFKDISPIVEINGADVVYFLEAHIAITSGLHDPDARYMIWPTFLSTRPLSLPQHTLFTDNSKGTITSSPPQQQTSPVSTLEALGPLTSVSGPAPPLKF